MIQRHDRIHIKPLYPVYASGQRTFRIGAQARYYRLATFTEAMGDFLGAVWHSRLLSDTTRYPLVREEAADSG